MINLGLFIDRFDPGGTQRQLLELLRGLDRSRFCPHVACFHGQGAWAERVRDLNVSMTAFPITGFARLHTVRQLAAFRRWCLANGIDVLHTWEIYSNTFGLPGAALARVPVRIGSRRGLNPDRGAGVRRLQRVAYRAAHRVIANSQAGARVLIEEGIPADRITVVYNGLDAAAFDAGDRAKPPRRVLTVAGLRRIKGIDVLIAAAAEVVRHVPDVRFTIVGDGPDRTDLVDQARRLGIDRHVEFLGYLEDIPARLAEADMFVLPSRSEAFPNALLEAMAAGLPVVASGVGGMLEVVEHGRTGLLVPPDDPTSLARTLTELAGDPECAAALGRAARAMVRERYSLRSMVEHLQGLYIRELAARKAVDARVASAA